MIPYQAPALLYHFPEQALCTSSHNTLQVCPGKIYSIEGINAARKIAGICDIICTKKIGDLVTDIHSSIDRMGCVIAQRGDAAAAIEACEQAMKQIKIEIYEEKSGK